MAHPRTFRFGVDVRATKRVTSPPMVAELTGS